MINLAILVFFSLFNIVGLILWARVALVMLDIVFCKDVRDLRLKISILKIFTRSTCIAIRRFYQKFQTSFQNMRFLAAFLFLIGSGAAILHRLSELSSHITTSTEFVRCIASVCIPFGIILVYRAFGHKIKFI